MGDILLRGGRVIDPARGMEQTADVRIAGGRIVPADGRDDAELVLDAEGCLVLPGLVDFHTHIFFRGTENSIPPDIGLLPQGVTTAVDGGTAGTANYELFFKTVIAVSVVRIKSFLSVSPIGQTTARFDETHDPQYFDTVRMRDLFARYRGELLGLKLRQSKEVVGQLGLAPFKEALKLAQELNCRIEVHTTNPPADTAELVELFRPGDIFTHVYHGKGSTIIGADGKVLPAVWRARERGVVFDAANGKNHFDFGTARAALADGFAPDVISSDLTWLTMFKPPAFGLPALMSKYLALGMPLADIVAACTSTPARLMGLEGEIGTLAPGACGDVAVFRLVDKKTEYMDAKGETMCAGRQLIPQATICGGRLVYRQADF